MEALRPAAERDGSDPADLVEQLRKAGRLDQLREDVASRQAVELLVREATPISVEQAKAREKLWTPGKDDSRGRARPALDAGKLTGARRTGPGPDFATPRRARPAVATVGRIPAQDAKPVSRFRNAKRGR